MDTRESKSNSIEVELVSGSFPQELQEMISLPQRNDDTLFEVKYESLKNNNDELSVPLLQEEKVSELDEVSSILSGIEIIEEKHLNMNMMEELAPQSSDFPNLVIPDLLKELTCPISQDVFVNPVLTCDGHTYERDCIENWLRDHNTSPLTNQPLAHRGLIPNVALRTLVQIYSERQKNLQKDAEAATDAYFDLTIKAQGAFEEVRKEKKSLQEANRKIQELEDQSEKTKAELQNTEALISSSLGFDDAVPKDRIRKALDPSVNAFVGAILAVEVQLAACNKDKSANLIKTLFLQLKMTTFLRNTSLGETHQNLRETFVAEEKKRARHMNDHKNLIRDAVACEDFELVGDLSCEANHAKSVWEQEKKQWDEKFEDICQKKTEARNTLTHIGLQIVQIKKAIQASEKHRSELLLDRVLKSQNICSYAEEQCPRWGQLDFGAFSDNYVTPLPSRKVNDNADPISHPSSPRQISSKICISEGGQNLEKTNSNAEEFDYWELDGKEIAEMKFPDDFSSDCVDGGASSGGNGNGSDGLDRLMRFVSQRQEDYRLGFGLVADIDKPFDLDSSDFSKQQVWRDLADAFDVFDLDGDNLG